MEVEPAPEEPAAASTSGAVPAAPARSPAGVQVAQVVVVQSDLPPDLQHDFRVIAARAVRAIPPGKYRDMAQLVKRYFDMNHDPVWHCVAGERFGSFMTSLEGHYACVKVNETVVFVIFKCHGVTAAASTESGAPRSANSSWLSSEPRASPRPSPLKDVTNAGRGGSGAAVAESLTKLGERIAAMQAGISLLGDSIHSAAPSEDDDSGGGERGASERSE